MENTHLIYCHILKWFVASYPENRLYLELCRHFSTGSFDKKWSFPLRISSVNPNPQWKTSFFVHCWSTKPLACYIPPEAEFHKDSKNAHFEPIKCNLKIYMFISLFLLLLPNFLLSSKVKVMIKETFSNKFRKLLSGIIVVERNTASEVLIW